MFVYVARISLKRSDKKLNATAAGGVCYCVTYGYTHFINVHYQLNTEDSPIRYNRDLRITGEKAIYEV